MNRIKKSILLRDQEVLVLARLASWRLKNQVYPVNPVKKGMLT